MRGRQILAMHPVCGGDPLAPREARRERGDISTPLPGLESSVIGWFSGGRGAG